MRRRVPSPSFPGLLLAAGSTFLLLAACTPEEEVVPLTGISAFKQMRKDRNHVPPTPFDSILSVMAEQSSGSAKPGDSAIEPEQPVANLLRKTTKAKLRLDPQKFDRPPASFFVEHRSAEKLRKLGKPGGVDVGALKHAEYHVPNVTSIPVRNQGERGTCASFAGIGHLEYLTLKRYGLRTMDLSEQRFYLMSRPDCARTGCVVDDEGGSWYGDGFQASKDSAAPPGDNIPLEADCPYNPRPGRNEMQIPQLTSCARGAAKVRGWRTVATPQEVVDVLEDEGLPVLWASPLSDNWFENKGLITYREAGSPGNVMHAGGHAYLLVGYRKLPNLESEGGMCFIVKNSWGTGWGVNGYSCQTLKWMQEWRFPDESGNKVWLDHPVLTDVELRSDLRGGGMPDNDDAEDESPPDIPDEELDDGDEGGDDGTPLPDPGPSPESWSDVPLYGPNDSYYKAQLARGSGGVMVRVELKGNVTYSKALGLYYEAGRNSYLEFDGDRVGELRDEHGDLLLCTDMYSMICSLRLNSDNDLYIEFPYPGNRGVKADELPDGSWFSLLTGLLFGYDLQVHKPKDETWFLDNPKAFFRMERPDGKRTQALRATRGSDTEVKVMGAPVGHILGGELCSGSYDGACRFMSADERFWVLPKW